ncbi:hypothetical protein PPYR_15168 [Photinus pyralis]|uniref:PiggyBac transposable element-derived protein domain-containing protein n=2 Tax=Photinus pyralis TaxID=7054 RepID=A0A5N3ZZG0_PHOPY|nr:hypothetical protein PPYR_15168 [Photinus pyralis]
MDIVIRETNREAKRVYAEWNSSNKDKPRKTWQETDQTEIEAFLGLLISAGAYRSGREDLSELWSEVHGRPLFRATMPLKRFQAIMRFIRFDNRCTRAERKSIDKLAAIRDIWDMFVQQLSNSYTPGLDMTIDEQLVGFRGNCPFRQYIKSKPSKYGIKIFWICDSVTAFPLKGQVYLGKQPQNQREVNQGARVVKDLVATWTKKGRNVVADNFFSSIPLVQDLLSMRTTYVGTLRKNKVEIPKEMQPHRSREVFSSLFGFSGELTVVSYVPKKSNAVVMLSTMHQDATVIGEEKKPEVILHYNSNKGAVDTMDKMVATYSCKRNTKRWPLVLFFNMLDVAGIAAMVIWLCHNPESFGRKAQKRRFFLLDLGRELVETYIQRRLQNKRCIQKGAKSGLLALGYNLDTPKQHQPEKVNTLKRSRCQLCPRSVDKKIKTQCNNCGVHICGAHSDKLISCNSCEGKL